MRAFYICVLLGLAVAAVIFLPSSTLSAYWPLALILACPLMHVFMGHGHHKHDHSTTTGGAK